MAQHERIRVGLRSFLEMVRLILVADLRVQTGSSWGSLKNADLGVSPVPQQRL